VVALDAVVGVLRRVVESGRWQLADDVLERLSSVGHRLLWLAIGVARASEEPAGRQNVTSLRDVHVDHLAVLIHGPVHVPPDTGDLDIGLGRRTSARRLRAGTAGPRRTPVV